MINKYPLITPLGIRNCERIEFRPPCPPKGGLCSPPWRSISSFPENKSCQELQLSTDSVVPVRTANCNMLITKSKINQAKNQIGKKRSSTSSQLVRTGCEWEDKHSEPGELNPPLGGQGGQKIPNSSSFLGQGGRKIQLTKDSLREQGDRSHSPVASSTK
jgi:hypothetical protein